MANPLSVRPIPSAQRFQDHVDATPTRDAELTLELSPVGLRENPAKSYNPLIEKPFHRSRP